MQTKKQIRADLELANAIIDQITRENEIMRAEIERQHGQIDTLTVLAEQATLNQKLRDLHAVADELLAQSKTMHPIAVELDDHS